MAKIEITIDDEQIEALSEKDGLAQLLQPVLNQILDAEARSDSGAGRRPTRTATQSTRQGHQKYGWLMVSTGEIRREFAPLD